MGKGFHTGTFLIFAAFALLLVSSITSPVTRIALFEARRSGSTITFGALGYCTNGNCTPRSIGTLITLSLSSWF